MPLTISSESTSYYSAGSYRNSIQKSSSDNIINSGSYYNASNISSPKEAVKPQDSGEAAAYEKSSDLLNYTKGSLDLSNLSVFDYLNTGEYASPAGPGIEMKSAVQNTDVADAGESSFSPTQLEPVKPDGNDLYGLIQGNSSAQLPHNKLAMQSNISSYMDAENNFRSAMRKFDASI